MGVTAAILGASGYAGGELIRLLDAHPEIDLGYLGGYRNSGRPLVEVHPHLEGGDRLLEPIDPDRVKGSDLVFLALPHGKSAETAVGLVGAGARVVDLGADMRLDTPKRYQSAYGLQHPLPEELEKWTYGLPELFDVRGSRAVAAPGCYPTAVLLSVAPLLVAGLVEGDPLVANALSGVSGAGRALKEGLLFGDIDEGVRAYAVGRHRHRPEMEMALEFLGTPTSVVFTPHLVPMQRGILATCTARALGTEAELRSCLRNAYRESAFVDVIDEPPQSRWVTGSNRALVYVSVDRSTAVVMGAIDNLLKGAAGQAVQSANLMLGLDESTGLPRSGLMP